MKFSSLIKTVTLTSCLATTAVANAAIIKPIYDTKEDYQKYWTPTFKQRTAAMCNLLGDHINDNVTIDITITIGDPEKMKNAFATGEPVLATYSTPVKYIAKTGTITINPHNYDNNKKEWKANNSSLILHEIIHCLGFDDGIQAFNANIDRSKSDNPIFKGKHTKAVNDGKEFPLNSAGDISHFKSDVRDKFGIKPRMMAGGGHLLSIVDLAVLADIGYTIPKIQLRESDGSRVPIWPYSDANVSGLNISLNGLLASSYKDDISQYGSKWIISGGENNDVIINSFSPEERIILWGGKGRDSLYDSSPYSGSAYNKNFAKETVMIGDDPDEVADGNDNNDRYFLMGNGRVTILLCGSNDRIYVPFSVDVARGISLDVTVEKVSTPSTTGNRYPFGKKELSYLLRKVTVFRTVSIREYELVDGKPELQFKIVRSKDSEIVFYSFAPDSMADAEFLEFIENRIIPMVNYSDSNYLARDISGDGYYYFYRYELVYGDEIMRAQGYDYYELRDK